MLQVGKRAMQAKAVDDILARCEAGKKRKRDSAVCASRKMCVQDTNSWLQSTLDVGLPHLLQHHCHLSR